jgi:hypothetical protein
MNLAQDVVLGRHASWKSPEGTTEEPDGVFEGEVPRIASE